IDSLNHIHKLIHANPVVINDSKYFIEALQNDSVKLTCLYKFSRDNKIENLGPALNKRSNGKSILKDKNNKILILGQDYEFTGFTPYFRGRMFISEMDTLGNIISTKFSTQQVGMN